MNLVQVSDKELMEVDGGNRRRRAQARRSSYSNREPLSSREALHTVSEVTGVAAAVSFKKPPVVAVFAVTSVVTGAIARRMD